MLIKYYRSNNQYNIGYSSRNRFISIPVNAFSQETQKSIKLGDGSATQIKTSVNNICDYVTIDNTRWFVVSYFYLNGKQIVLNLQRDVIGEMGISSCYGKVERGYTETVLRNRKELQLNQILKERKKLIPETNIYGNFSVSTHLNEMWGILYLVKPSGIDPNTGEKYKDTLNINIPAFNPQYLDLDFVDNGTVLTYGSLIENTKIRFLIKYNNRNAAYRITINFNRTEIGFTYTINVIEFLEIDGYEGYTVSCNVSGLNIENLRDVSIWVGKQVANAVIANSSAQNGYSFPEFIEDNNANFIYNNAVVKSSNGDFYSYTLSDTSVVKYGNVSGSKSTFVNTFIIPYIVNKNTGIGINGIITSATFNNNDFELVRTSNYKRNAYKYNNQKLSEEEAGTITIDLSINLIDEPYSVLIFPLFDVTLTEVNTSNKYTIEKKRAFEIFNTIIQYLSGDNEYLVDAQIYPYCPELTSVATSLQGYPFFQLMSTSFDRKCSIQLMPFSDIKKEYIEREYTIISPEQTGRFTFNFYDYVNNIEDNDGVNFAKLDISIKTALKPFSIISSAVILPEDNSLIGITYGSDLRGSQPSSNGFECSLSSNAFEEYKRSNSNYQQIFALQQEELKKQHEVELTNDITQTVVNTASATAMGAIAGNAMGDAGIGSLFGTKAAGAAVGGITAGATVGAAMTAQTIMNSQLRDYEEYLQKQTFDLNIGTIKNIPNSVNRISSFNEIILRDFWYIIEVYECSDDEKIIVDNFINQYGYSIGVFDFVANYHKDGWFLRSTLVKSNYPVNLHMIAEKELMGGIYYYEQV